MINSKKGSVAKGIQKYLPFSGGRWGLPKRLEAFVEGFRKLFSPYIGLNLYNGALDCVALVNTEAIL